MTNATTSIRTLGPLKVSTEAGIVREFRRQTGWASSEGPPPHSFPVVWIAKPEIGDAIMTCANEVGAPVHEAQQFDYQQPLETDKIYDLMVEFRREAKPPRLIVTGDFFELNGAFVGRTISTLRLVEQDVIASSLERETS